MPLEGAVLHVGVEARDDLLRAGSAEPSVITGTLGAVWGIPVVVDEEDPNLIELRWKIRG